MKLLTICNPRSYDKPLLDIPIFYQRLAAHPRVDFFHLPTDRVLDPRKPEDKIPVAPVRGELTYEAFLDLNELAKPERRLDQFDLVFCRTLKPFPQGYLDRLSSWEPQIKFVNSPTNKKEQIEPDFLLKVAAPFLPETIVTSDWQKAQSFFEAHGTIVAKQYNSCGGRGVFKIWYQNGCFQIDNLLAGTREFANFSAAMPYLQGGSNKPVQFIRYLKRVNEGDKRIVVVDGEIYGAYIRRSKSGHWVNNVSGDGESFLAEIAPEEREAIEGTVEHYRSRGLLTLGYDFLMDEGGTWRISEINAGNVGGFARLELLSQQPVMERLISWLVGFASS
ncbi:MAG: hypothetical protein F6J93_34695 [Oscillatoria sp. SIO1A7]|nr:hypothetical protein [Oscillatoria sp. SIO1A7]